MSQIALSVVVAAFAIGMFGYRALAAEEEDAEAARSMAAVRSCLAIAAAKEDAAQTAQADAPETKSETAPAGYFAFAAAEAALAAGYARENCIGVISNPCAEAEGYSLMGEHACIGAEAEAWEALLNEAYRKRLNLPPPDLTSDETPEDEAARPHAAAPVPECQPMPCEISANDNLRKVQRAFATWRDAMCEQNYIESQGGRENQIEISRCRMALTARQMLWMEYGQSFER